MGIITARDLAYEYIRRDENGNVEDILRAVDGVTLDIEAGDFIAILGHNGSGKSTLAKQMNALLTPSEGTLYVDGKNVAEEANLWDVRQTAGMVFQNPDNQIIAQVVEEDVGFGPENMGVPSDEIRRRVDDALRAVGMLHYASHAPHKLSGGQKQRVAIAGVIAMQPRCIVLDEPTAMLDPVGRDEVLETIHRLNREMGITIVLITHHMNEAAEADRVIAMDRGRVILDGTPEEVFTQVDVLREIGLTVPQPVELLDRLEREDGISLPLEALTPEACAKVLYQYYSEA